MCKKYLIYILSLVCLLLGCNNKEYKFKPLRVAHAGGGINRDTYTNSYEALDYNIKKGFSYFEIDLSYTSDEKLVCIHDWDDSFKKTFGFSSKEKPTFEQFKLLAKKSKYNNCTLDGLVLWMQKNPSAVIITDIKEDNLKALLSISKKMKQYKTRIIPQIYQPQNFNAVKKMGYQSIIWTLYEFQRGLFDALRWIDSFEGRFAITMLMPTALKTSLPKELMKRKIPSYVHTINVNKEANYLINKLGVSEIYTDFLTPKRL